MAWHCSYDFGEDGFEYLPPCSLAESEASTFTISSGSISSTNSPASQTAASGSGANPSALQPTDSNDNESASAPDFTDPSSESPSSTPKVLPIGLGVGVGGSAIFFVIIGSLWYRRRQRQRSAIQPFGPSYLGDFEKVAGTGTADGKPELDATVFAPPKLVLHELPPVYEPERQEMDGADNLVFYGPQRREDVVEIGGGDERWESRAGDGNGDGSCDSVVNLCAIGNHTNSVRNL